MGLEEEKSETFKSNIAHSPPASSIKKFEILSVENDSAVETIRGEPSPPENIKAAESSSASLKPSEKEDLEAGPTDNLLLGLFQYLNLILLTKHVFFNVCLIILKLIVKSYGFIYGRYIIFIGTFI